MSGQGSARPGNAPARREYGYALVTGAAGAGLVLLAVRQRWAQAVFTPPKPLAPQVVAVAGTDIVPLAGALALAALAGLAAVIATRGLARRAAGAAIALFGAGAGVAAAVTVTAATVLNVAAGKIASPQVAADSGAAGSTTSGSSRGGGPLVVAGAAGRAIMSGAPWRIAVLAGALLIFAVGVATVLRGPGWPVMSARYDAPRSHAGQDAARRHQLDAASMWESLSVGADPTETGDADPGDPAPDGPAPHTAEPAGEARAAGQREGKA